MNNKEQIKNDLNIAMDFVEQIIETPELLDKIPDGAVVDFLNTEIPKSEKPTSALQQKKYVKVKHRFEVM